MADGHWETGRTNELRETTGGNLPELLALLQPFTEGLTEGLLKFSGYHFQQYHFRRILQLNRAGGKHNLFTYFPKDPNCEVWRRTKSSRAPYKRDPLNRVDRLHIARTLWRYSHSGS